MAFECTPHEVYLNRNEKRARRLNEALDQYAKIDKIDEDDRKFLREEGVYYCKSCCRMFHTVKQCLDHFAGKVHHNKKGTAETRFCCKVCNYHCNQKHVLKRHQKTNHHKLLLMLSQRNKPSH